MSVPYLTARAAGLIGCTTCGQVGLPQLRSCARCGAALASRPRHGLQPVLAWLIAGMLLYIPANLWPMLITRTLGREEASTIIGGVLELFAHGSYGIAAIVFTASVAIPIAKFAAIAILVLAAVTRTVFPVHALVTMYEVVEFIGRWSMIDIFVVAILSALVQLGFIASLAPGPAAGCFAASVACTMMAARSIDPRLIWDRIGGSG
ncbi:MAG: paraquat-inducible protein A [Geodermatophilaceae bacterium]|nr:paraquat-inducible protein A [Geodermatophilaceae bacterium]